MPAQGSSESTDRPVITATNGQSGAVGRRPLPTIFGRAETAARLRELGFESLDRYLRQRYLEECASARGISLELFARERGQDVAYALQSVGVALRHQRPIRDHRYHTDDPPPSPIGALADGTPYFAPLGDLPYDPERDLVQCHLCGLWFRQVSHTHLQLHGWSIDEYKQAMGLLHHRALCTPTRSAQLAECSRRRLESDPRWREGLEHALALMRTPRGRQLQRQGIRGRPLPLEHVLRHSQGYSEAARRRRIREADRIVAGFGFASFEAYWRDRCQQGMMRTGMARELGHTLWWIDRVAEELTDVPFGAVTS